MMQATYLDALMWTHASWKSIAHAFSSTLQKDSMTLATYLDAAKSTGDRSITALLACHYRQVYAEWTKPM